MINILLTLLIILLSIIAIIALIILFIYFKVKKTLKQTGMNYNLSSLMNEFKNASYEVKNNPKSISGMTRLIEPRILNDFPSFNKNELYTKCESNLRTIFKVLESNDVTGLSDLPLLEESLKKIVTDNLESKKEVEYGNIQFHEFAIKGYEKKDGAATIEIAATLQHSYRETLNNKIVKDEELVQKRYSCKFVYIYDELKFDSSEYVLGINCPNCGAAVTKLGNKSCSYCHSQIEDINLKSWHMSSYKEY